MTIERKQPIEWYLNSPNVSHSKLRDFAEHGARYYHDRYLAKTIPREETQALTFGQAFETLLQRGGEAFAKEVMVAPVNLDGRTKEGKAWKAAAAGKLAVSQDDYQAMLEMASSVREHVEAAGKVEACEQQITLTGEAHGLTLQSRPDYVLLSELCPLSIDLKTTKNLNDLSSTGIVKLGYHTQAAMVRRLLALNGLPDATCYLLVVEKCLPYRCALMRLSSALLDAGDRWLDTYAPRLAECMQQNCWPRTSTVDVEPPRWLLETA